jgi:glycosyltransferase involved in cell wall biosynthesis
MTDSLPKTLFIGRTTAGIAWYRCALPATALGLDWICHHGGPPPLHVLAGNKSIETLDVSDYEVIVVQLGYGQEWVDTIRQWQARGITVLYEIDDWLRGIRKLEEHTFKDTFGLAEVASHEIVMRQADGIICSTEYLAKRYRKQNRRTWVCRNGIDLPRYQYTLPQRDLVGIGWAGGTGHLEGARPWFLEVANVMEQRANTRFISVGMPYGASFGRRFGTDRALDVPWTALENYPAAMTNFDIAIAPAGKGGFFQGKSDLRWLEASALRIPLIADPDVYPEIEHGVTGFHARTPDEVRELLLTLVDDPDLRRRVGDAAHEYVATHRTVQAMAPQWRTVLTEVTSGAAPQEVAA